MNEFKMCVKYLKFLFLICGINIILCESFATGLVQFKIDPIVISKHEFDVINEITPQEWKGFAERGVASNDQDKRLEDNLVASNVVVRNGTISHVQLLDILPSVEARKNSEVAEEILKSSLFVYNSKCAPVQISGNHCEAILSDIVLPEDSLLNQKCQKILNAPPNGQNPFRRLLQRHYKDGFYKMFKDELPPPLLVRRALNEDYTSEYLDDYQRNLVLVQWSQFVANDLSNPVVTSMSNGFPIECCNIQNYKLPPRHHHPACEPLISKDVSNKYGRDTCLNYVRSALGIGDRCTFAAPDQLNQATSKLDLSQLYGFTEKSQARMRLFKDGLLKSTNAEKSQDSLLPIAEQDSFWFCARANDKYLNSTCFMAGDSRVNNSPLTILIYTIMMRNHNRIAKDLKICHPDWQDAELFTKAKLINIEIYQSIIFNEWLPIILGTSMATEINSYTKKMPSSEAVTFDQVSNEYAVAASRFYLSMMPDKLTETNVNSLTKNNDNPKTNLFTLKNEMYSPSIVYTSTKLDEILYAILRQPAMKLDSNYAESLITNLENNYRPQHSDLLAFDIQRGRDHGLQPYVKYLEICNNIKINGWNDLHKFIRPQHLNKLKAVYKTWNDIDLIVGGISEISAQNATVGSTFQCIIGEQFAKLRQQHQEQNINIDSDLIKFKHMTASDLLCLNTNLKHVPRNIFNVPSETNNSMVNCSELVNKWI